MTMPQDHVGMYIGNVVHTESRVRHQTPEYYQNPEPSRNILISNWDKLPWFGRSPSAASSPLP